ncbi:MAG: hypothetical protein EBR28_04880 [Planctomycetia bacterium]|nr:hypothetical protein [Planctomycetia bacterium]
MPIEVVCPGCKSRFSVSDHNAGRTGPCPKCKQPITIPKPAVQAVTIHEPEAPVASSRGTGRIPTAPIKSSERPVSGLQVAAVFGGGIFAVVMALLARLAWHSDPPTWALAVAAVALSFPCVLVGYRITRDRELEPYRGRALAVRVAICAAVYAGLWAVRTCVPADMTAEMWQWLYVAPIFLGVGALASFATLDLDWGVAAAHYSLYVLFTAVLRWLAGLTPI